jgi:regulator of sigma E protease
MNSVLLSIFAFLFAIGILVAVHEWGHYIVARLVGVKVLRFSIGFGKPLWTKTAGADGTEYCISAIPLGGYVKLLDEREGDVSAEERHRAFNCQSIAARVAILIAGPLLNFIFAILAYWMMFIIGVPGVQPIIGELEADSIAAHAGLQSGDRLLTIGNQPVETWEGSVLAILDSVLAAEHIDMTVMGVEGVSRRVEIDVAGKTSELTEPGALFSGLGLKAWSPKVEPVLGELSAGEAAEAAGLLPGDRIVAADDQSFAEWIEWVEFVRARPGKTTDVVVNRDGSEVIVSLTIGELKLEDDTTIGRIGAGPLVPEGLYDKYRAEQRYGPVAAFAVAVDRTWSMSALTVRMVVRMVTGDVSVKNISGPINIAQYAGYTASIGVAAFLNFLAVVSLSLGILNLLPIPVLDGGQVVYQLIEAAKGAPLSERAQLFGQQVGIAFLMLLMGFAFYNDLTRVFS